MEGRCAVLFPAAMDVWESERCCLVERNTSSAAAACLCPGLSRRTLTLPSLDDCASLCRLTLALLASEGVPSLLCSRTAQQERALDPLLD